MLNSCLVFLEKDNLYISTLDRNKKELFDINKYEVEEYHLITADGKTEITTDNKYFIVNIIPLI